MWPLPWPPRAGLLIHKEPMWSWWEGTGAHLLQEDTQRNMEAVRCEIRTGPWQCGPHQLMHCAPLDTLDTLD